MDFTGIILEKKDHAGILTLNRPPVNAVNLKTLEEIESALDDLENNSDVRVVIITGAGEKSFSAGFDVSEAGQSDITVPKGQAVWTRIDRFEKPVIAAINGFALGGGCELALACHFRIMTDNPDIRIGLTELNLGIIPGWGGTQRMARQLGKSRALDLILFSRKLTPGEALKIGLVDRISSGEVINDALDMAAGLSTRPPLAVARVLRAISAGEYRGIDEGLRIELDGCMKAGRSEDAAEGFTAFLEKRDPVFKGK